MVGSELLLLFIVFEKGENTKSIASPIIALEIPRDVGALGHVLLHICVYEFVQCLTSK